MTAPPTRAPQAQKAALPTRAAVACALVLTGPALLHVVQGDLDATSAAIRFLVALPVSLVALAVVSAALRPAGQGNTDATGPAGPEGPLQRRRSDGDPDWVEGEAPDSLPAEG
jgi:hypothetical protein